METAILAEVFFLVLAGIGLGFGLCYGLVVREKDKIIRDMRFQGFVYDGETRKTLPRSEFSEMERNET